MQDVLLGLQNLPSKCPEHQMSSLCVLEFEVVLLICHPSVYVINNRIAGDDKTMKLNLMYH